jgi:hypothetical protein
LPVWLPVRETQAQVWRDGRSVATLVATCGYKNLTSTVINSRGWGGRTVSDQAVVKPADIRAVHQRLSHSQTQSLALPSWPPYPSRSASARTPRSSNWLVSKGIAGLPRWASSGKQLPYFTVGSADIMAVDIETTRGFQAGTLRRLFRAPPLGRGGWDLAGRQWVPLRHDAQRRANDAFHCNPELGGCTEEVRVRQQASSMPSLSSSPWIRGAPRPDFNCR